MASAAEDPARHQLYQVRARVLRDNIAATTGNPKATLDDVPDAYLHRVADAGFTVLYLLGVWSNGAAGLLKSRQEVGAGPDDPSVCSSPFAITGYTVREELGGDEALKRLRKRSNDAGLLMMVDFVPNHVAIDHPWVYEHPDYLMLGTPELLSSRPDVYFQPAKEAKEFLPKDVDIEEHLVLAHGRDPNFGGWTDTIQLNYFRPETRAAMTDILVHIASELADGVRCDMAMLVVSEVFQRTWGSPGPDGVTEEFWPEAISACKAANPSFVFLAEVYWDMEFQLQQLGFDYTYDKRLLDRLEDADGPGVVGHLSADLAFQKRSARLIENHDEKRAATSLSKAPHHHEAAAVVAMTVPGLLFFHDGQLSGRKDFHSMHYGPRKPEPEDPAVALFYHRLLQCLKTDAVRHGTWSRCAVSASDDGDPSHGSIVAHTWDAGTREHATAGALLGGAMCGMDSSALLFCVANISTAPSTGHIHFLKDTSLADLKPPEVCLLDQLSPASFVREVGDKGVWFRLEPLEAHVFKVVPVCKP